MANDNLINEAEEVANAGKAPTLNTRTQFMIGVPVGLRIELEKGAKEQNKSLGRFVSEILAGAAGYTLPVKTSGGKAKMSDAEKKAAQKARNAEQRSQIRDLLARVRQEEGLDDEDEEDDEDEA
jgi:hypothetical protein